MISLSTASLLVYRNATDFRKLLLKFNTPKINNTVKKWAEDMNRHFPKTSRWLTDPWKDVKHHLSSEKDKSKPRWDYHLTQDTKDIGKDMEKREPSYIADGNTNRYSHSGKQYSDSSKKLKIELSDDPEIALLGIFPKDMKILIWRGTCTPMFTAAFQQEPNYGKSPNVDQLMNGERRCGVYMCVCMYVCMYIHYPVHVPVHTLLSHQKGWNLAICNDVHRSRMYYVKQNKSEKNKYHMISLIYGI